MKEKIQDWWKYMDINQKIGVVLVSIPVSIVALFSLILYFAIMITDFSLWILLNLMLMLCIGSVLINY